jgi:hypothetical protein
MNAKLDGSIRPKPYPRSRTPGSASWLSRLSEGWRPENQNKRPKRRGLCASSYLIEERPYKYLGRSRVRYRVRS